MAHKYFSGGWHMNVEISEGAIAEAVASLSEYRNGLKGAANDLARGMADKGAELAKEGIVRYDAIDTGRLLRNVSTRKGQDVPEGAMWEVVSDLPYSVYVEFGTGPATSIGTVRRRDGRWFPARTHPSGRGDYRATGWTYGGTYTIGMPARPFMWDAWTELKKDETFNKVVGEVFG